MAYKAIYRNTEYLVGDGFASAFFVGMNLNRQQAGSVAFALNRIADTTRYANQSGELKVLLHLRQVLSKMIRRTRENMRTWEG